MLVSIILFLGIILILMSCTAFLIMPTVYARLHFLSSASIGALLIGFAVFIQEGFNQQGIKALLIVINLFLIGPILIHATARAGKIRTREKS